MIFVLTLATLLAVYAGVDAGSCHMREIDLCLATTLMAATDGVPADDEEIDRVCEPILEGIECFGNYSTECFTPVIKEIYDMMLSEPIEMEKKFCTRGSEERLQYLKNAPCFQKVLATENVRPHLDDMIAALEKATESKFNERIPILCCGMQRMFGAMVDLVKAECGEAILEEGSAMLGMSISSVQGMFCRGFERDSAKCASLLPPPGTQSKGAGSSNQLIRFISSAMASFV